MRKTKIKSQEEKIFDLLDEGNALAVGAFEKLVVNGELIAFAQNDSLESYKIPSTVHTIGSWTMNGSLTTVYIPKNVTKIKKHAFANRKSIDCIYCESTTPPDLQDDSAFDTPHRIAKIYVPASAVDKYKAAGGWKNYADRIFPTDRDIN